MKEKLTKLTDVALQIDTLTNEIETISNFTDIKFEAKEKSLMSYTFSQEDVDALCYLREQKIAYLQKQMEDIVKAKPQNNYVFYYSFSSDYYAKEAIAALHDAAKQKKMISFFTISDICACGDSNERPEDQYAWISKTWKASTIAKVELVRQYNDPFVKYIIGFPYPDGE